MSQPKPLLRLVLLGLITLGCIFAWTIWQARTPTFGQSLTPSADIPNSTISLFSTPAITQTISANEETATPTSTPTLVLKQPETWIETFGVLQDSLAVLALDENSHSQLFAYQPGLSPFIRLTSGKWDDIQPALNPAGDTLAFASNRGGRWDLYLLNLYSGELEQITDTPEFDGAPSWSPDGRWLAYESYREDTGSLEIFVRPLDGAQEPIQLTDDPGADFDPAWSPLGRQIAFVSTRSGENEIWLADLDLADNRFRNASRNNHQTESHPTWSPDGSQLVWSTVGASGIHELSMVSTTSLSDPHPNPRMVGSGSWAAWSPTGQALLTILSTPNQYFLTGYGFPENTITLPPLRINGAANGITWGRLTPGLNLTTTFASAAQTTPAALWQPALTPMADIPAGRQRLVEVHDIQAPNAVLQDLVDESFIGLRERVAQAAGWDLLANLENAYVPLTIPLGPGLEDDWLYTGRAFAFNPLPANAGWIVVLREDYGAQTYWRVMMRARYQDGTQGRPLDSLPWDFNARASGDPRAYETGGAFAKSIPAGYWIDFTRLAADYDWERLPALSTWRSAYSAARFHEFVHTAGLDWQDAMLEIYPAEALVTPTVIVPTTGVPTRTLR
ncbi:MAG TPA: hypothetical protein VN363_03760, partial [Anaerolineales bacterium]|nr:hypothetical protein [Anaerolineales bacterium]